MTDRHAGACPNGVGNDRPKSGQWRHRWGKEERRSHGAMHSLYGQRCKRCDRVRLIEYTNRGNHVAGYVTEERASV